MRRDASRDEIERSYRLAMSTYSEDSLAGYSVFGEGDTAALRERIEVAYRVLSDGELRREYDAGLSGATSADGTSGTARGTATARGVEVDGVIEASLEALIAAEAPAQPDVIREAMPPMRDGFAAAPPSMASPTPVLGFEELDDGTGDFDGDRLRRYRMRCGMEIDDIAATTKISVTYLRFIEEEQFADLPSPVYVRGFVSAFATCLGLDSKRVATSYMKRYDELHPGRRKGRFFEGR